MANVYRKIFGRLIEGLGIGVVAGGIMPHTLDLVSLYFIIAGTILAFIGAYLQETA